MLALLLWVEFIRSKSTVGMRNVAGIFGYLLVAQLEVCLFLSAFYSFQWMHRQRNQRVCIMLH